MEGYKLMFDRMIVTVWSAPNYCYRCASVAQTSRIMGTHNDGGSCGNVASILELDENLQQEYKVFRHAPAVRIARCDIFTTLSLII
jgi:serine/threonine-protein phosphatase 4 catalytic subunit